jgi:hypothetical protein
MGRKGPQPVTVVILIEPMMQFVVEGLRRVDVYYRVALSFQKLEHCA